MVKVHYDANGDILGFYPDEIEYPSIPEPYIEIIEDQWRDAINNQGKYSIYNGAFVAASVWPLVLTLDQVKQQKLVTLKAARNTQESGGFSYLGKTLDSDTVSIQRISIVTLAAQAAIAAEKTFNIDWSCADNTILMMTAEQVVGMSTALAEFMETIYSKYRALKSQVEAATTVDEVNAVTW